LAPLPHTHRAALAVPLLPGHLQQDRHSALAHTHQAQGDAVRREGVFVEDGDCPAEETAAATSATAASAPRAPGRALLRLRVTLTVPRAARLPGPQVVPRPRGGVRGSGTSGGSVHATVLSRLDRTGEPREDSRISSITRIVARRDSSHEKSPEKSLGIRESRGSPEIGRCSSGREKQRRRRSPPEPRRKLDQRSTRRCVGSRGKSVWPHCSDNYLPIRPFVASLFGRVVVPLVGTPRRREAVRAGR